MSNDTCNPVTCQYNLPELPDGTVLLRPDNFEDRSAMKWSGSYPIPTIGERVDVLINKLGHGTVESYFVEHGFVGITVKLDAPPDWHRKQTAGTHYEGKALVFGKEINIL